jgi:tRNA dimethylallyltransferase
MNKELIIIVGPTAVGKTKTAISVAKTKKTEIISADSRQIFKEMNIGVARPSKEELKEVRHHFIAKWSIFDSYNVARYEKEAMETINELFTHYDTLVLCGGSGLYVDAIRKGIDYLPDIPIEVRKELNDIYTKQGIEPLQEELKRKDEEYFSIVDTMNPRRLIRALEVIRVSGKPYSFFRKMKPIERDFSIKVIGLTMNKEELNERIDKRVDMMIEDGLIEEAKSLYPHKDLNALNTVGYKELFDYFDKKTTFDEAINLIKTHTHQYAKRQMTYFKKNTNTLWLNLSNKDIDIKDYI